MYKSLVASHMQENLWSNFVTYQVGKILTHNVLIVGNDTYFIRRVLRLGKGECHCRNIILVVLRLDILHKIPLSYWPNWAALRTARGARWCTIRFTTS